MGPSVTVGIFQTDEGANLPPPLKCEMDLDPAPTSVSQGNGMDGKVMGFR